MNYVEEFKSKLKIELPNIDEQLLSLYALLGLIVGIDVTLEDVHDAWSIWMTRFNSNHRSIVPFNMLSTEVQEMDGKYADAIYKVCMEMRDNV